MPSLNAA